MRFIRSSLLNRDLSVLGFGTAAVLGRVGRRQSLSALGHAFDSGINLFDTARSYGYGEAESLLGEFLAGRRSQAVICTKFGIVPSPNSPLKRALKPVARAVMRVAPALRGAIRGQASHNVQSGSFNVPTLRTSIENSLRSLRTDYVDMLLIHEAHLAALENHELLSAMEQLVASGKVRFLGVSSSPDVARKALRNPALRVVQFPCNAVNNFESLSAHLSAGQPVLRLANQPYGGPGSSRRLEDQLRRAAHNPDLPASLRSKLSAGAHPNLLAEAVLQIVLSLNDAVITSMFHPGHIKSNIAAVSATAFDPSELRLLRDFLLPPVPGARQEASALGN